MELIKQEYRNILVPVDGSKTAEKALERATEIALRNKAHLDILNVIDLKQFSVSCPERHMQAKKVPQIELSTFYLRHYRSKSQYYH